MLTDFIADKTPFPRNLLGSLSLNSIASNLPVDAPEGTEALPVIEFVRITSTSIVGLPLESIISLAKILLILLN